MNGFRFNLQQVLDLREQHQRQMAARLNEVEADAGRAREAQQTLEEIRHAGARTLERAHRENNTVGQLRTLAYVIEQMNHRVIDAQSRVEMAEQLVDQAKGELTTALQARQVLTRLRERHFAGWRSQSNAQDLRQMDELALVRHARKELASLDGENS